jgi:hypothetical protein
MNIKKILSDLNITSGKFLRQPNNKMQVIPYSCPTGLTLILNADETTFCENNIIGFALNVFIDINWI